MRCRCYLPSGKTLWLCPEHQQADDRITVFSNDEEDVYEEHYVKDNIMINTNKGPDVSGEKGGKDGTATSGGGGAKIKSDENKENKGNQFEKGSSGSQQEPAQNGAFQKEKCELYIYIINLLIVSNCEIVFIVHFWRVTSLNRLNVVVN